MHTFYFIQALCMNTVIKKIKAFYARFALTKFLTSKVLSSKAKVVCMWLL